VYRGWGIPCAGTRVCAPRYREEWLNKLPQAGVRRRAELLYQQLDGLQALRRNLRQSTRGHDKFCSGRVLTSSDFARPSEPRSDREQRGSEIKAERL
jgi:hypothetical protein